MSELALFSKNALPAYLKKIELDETTKSLMGGSSGKRISIKGGVFRMIVGGKEVAQNDDRAMNVVIVRSAPKVSRTFYSGTYVEGTVAAPECWSADGELPDASIKKPQCANCANCPQNIKGSGQGDSRACRFTQRLAVVLENDLQGDVYQLALPSQSIFGKGESGKMPLQQYAKFLAGHNVPITAVVTEMRFDTSSATPKLTFKPTRPLEEAEYDQCREQGASPDAIDAVTMTVAQTDGVKAQDVEADEESTAVVKAAAKKTVKAETDAEPVKRESKAKAEVKPIASIVDAWADDEE